MVPDSGDAYLIDATSPTELVLMQFDDEVRNKLADRYLKHRHVDLPTFKLKLEGLVDPPARSDAFVKGRDELRFYGHPGVQRKWSTEEILGFGVTGPSVVSFQSTRPGKKGVRYGHADYYRSEPSADFQYHTWSESLEEPILRQGFAKIGNVSSLDVATRKRWLDLQNEAKAKKLGMWAGPGKPQRSRAKSAKTG
jgi:hypothetical protein